MATQFSPPLLMQPSIQLIAALLLSNYVIAQYIGLRPARSIREVLGISLCIAATLVITSALDWLLMRLALLPLGLIFLRFFCAVLITAVVAHIVEVQLARCYPNLFPTQGNFLPLIIVSSLILWLPLQHSDSGFGGQLIYACAYALGAALLLPLFQALREHNASAEIPRPLRGAAIDMLSAAILIAACSGLAGVL